MAEVVGLITGKLTLCYGKYKKELKQKGKWNMRLKHILIVFIVLVCCSPFSGEEHNLIGNWKYSNFMISTTIAPNDPTNTIIFWDTIWISIEFKFNSNQMRINDGLRYVIHDSLSWEGSDTFSYSASNNILTIWKETDKKAYYNYNIVNDSLFIAYSYGDTSLKSFQSARLKRE